MAGNFAEWKRPPRLCCVIVLTILAVGGCVERKLTINTNPPGAVVTLNDEEVGQSPVTTPFNWYGDYRVRISKSGYETLITSRKLEAPWYDYFPFDFFAQVLPGRTVNSYEWSFDLEPQKEIKREELVKKASQLRSESQ